MMQQLLQIQERIFQSASEILRHTKLQQHFGNFVDPTKTKFCALGAIYKHYGWNGNGLDSNWRDADYKILVDQLGLMEDNEFSNVIRMNDLGHAPFNIIADYLEDKGL